LNKNKYKKSGSSSGKASGGTAGKKKHGGESGSSIIPEEELISWYRADTEVFEAAAKDKAPIVLYFVEEGLDPIDASKQLHDTELAKLSDDNFLFVMVEYNPDRTPSFDNGSPVPTSKLLSPNPSRDYNITKYPSYLVCDWFGNEYDRYTKTPGAKDLKKQLEGVSDAVEKANAKLQGTLDEAKKALEAKDTRNFMKAAIKNFKTGTVGLASQEETIALYRKVIDQAREEVNSILENRPEDAKDRLKQMAKDYGETELASEIKDAQDIIKG